MSIGSKLKRNLGLRVRIILFVPLLVKRLVDHLFLVRKSKKMGARIAKPGSTCRSSDRVYILGSGASINDIKDWRKIREHDSIGFNFWPLHWFAPTFYFVEIPRDIDRKKNLIDILKNKGEDYANVKVFYKLGKEVVMESMPNIGDANYAFVPLAISAPTKSLYRYVACIVDVVLRRKIFFSEGTSSVDTLIMFSALQGYKEIILCGVDLSCTKYFYEATEVLDPHVANLAPTTGQENRKIHKTNDPEEPRFGLTVEESIVAMKPFLSSNGCSLYIENPKSALANVLPTMKH